MYKIIAVLLIPTFILTGCSSVRESRANPFNWFGSGSDAPAPAETQSDNPLIPESTGFFAASRAERARYKGTPIQSVTEVTLERVPGGMLILATGVSQTQGAYDVRLIPEGKREEPVDGILAYRFEAVPNPDIRTQGSVESRTVTVARRLTDQQLADARVIRVAGVQNVLEARRR